VVQWLVAQGSDNEKADNYSRTPLHIAAKQGHANVVVCLLSHGAKLNVRDTAGKLPVDDAATEEIKQIIRDEEQRRRDAAV
jgi:cytohesin